MTCAEGAKISGIYLTAHPQRRRSFSRVCAMRSVTFPHPVLHIPLMWNTEQALYLGSIDDEGSSTPARLDFRVISLIAPACQKRPHLPSTYAFLYAITFGRSSSTVLPPPGTPPPQPGFAPTPRLPLRLAGLSFVGATSAVVVTVGEAEVSNGVHQAVWSGPRVGCEIIPPP